MPFNPSLAVFNVLSFFLFTFFSPAGERPQPDPLVIEGRTMGTTYRIVYFDEPRRRNFGGAVDSLLAEINRSINTYDPDSDISRFNKSKNGIRSTSPHLYEILRAARSIYRASDGAFDPTVMPLVNAWGFGPEKSMTSAEPTLDSLKRLVGFDKVRFTKKRIRKDVAGLQLDMGGIGQGYGADQIFRFLRENGIQDMLVELGGEGIASGRNLQKDKAWTIGILNPHSTTDNQFFKAYVSLNDQAFTTSGNYFNYRVIAGRKYGHTIDPVTGYPVQHSLLSASVFAPDCTSADAWATALMVMGVDKAMDKIKAVKKLEAILIYSDEDGTLRTYVSPGIHPQVTLE